ncbi:MAG: radical SAM protein [archaeon]
MSEDNKLRYILLEVTDKCNFRCRHCRVYGWDEIKNPLETKEIYSLIDQAKKMGVETITFTGGEPLLRSDIIEIIKYCSSKGISSKLQTNGSLVTEKIIKDLKKAGLKIFGTGIDGSTEKIHSDLRQSKNSLQKVKDAIKLAKKNGLEVHTETTITKLNHKDINKIMNLAEKLGVNCFFVRSIVIAGCAENDLIITKQEYKKVLESVYKKKYKKSKTKFTSQDPLFHLIDKKLMKKLETKYGDIYSGKYYGGCVAGLNTINVKSDGDVRICSFLPLSIGNIRTNKLEKIWGEKRNYCERIVDRKIEGKCENCKNKYICGGCRSRALILNKNLYGEDPFCWKK